MENNQPKGIGFYNIKTGETRYAQLEAQIQAYINSSDIGINASRDQDFYWRLEPEWVKKVRAYRRNEAKMERLTERNGGQKVTVPQILYAIYGEQLRAAQERADENETPFEEEYLEKISSRSEEVLPEAAVENVSEEDLPEEKVEDVNPSEPTGSGPDGIASPSEEEPPASDGNKPADSEEESSNRKTASKTKKK